MTAAPVFVTPDRRLHFQGKTYVCALGRSGIVPVKHEGDGATPVGRFCLRRAYFRADKGPAPQTDLPLREIMQTDGWCDAPEHRLYNRPVTLPFAASHEKLWRNDDLYDLIVEMGQNDAPPVPGGGSAVFIHVARPDYGPTEGCVALAKDDLRALLAAWSTRTIVDIRADAD